MWVDCVSKDSKTCSTNWLHDLASKFLQIINHQIREELTRKGTKLGVEVGLEILLRQEWRGKNYNMGEKKLGRKVFLFSTENTK